MAIFLIAAVIIIALMGLTHAAQQSTALDEVYARTAPRLGGRASPGGLFGRPSLRFHHRGAPALVDICSTGGEHPNYYTQLHIAWPDHALRCEICPERLMSRVGKFFGMEDIQIGSPRFDERYLITGNSPQEIRHLLNHAVQAHIETLRGYLGNDDIYVGISGGRLLVKKQPLIRDHNTLESFVRMALDLFDHATSAGVEGIDFVEGAGEEALLSLAEAICQICGDEVERDAVFCRSCKTPHHHDCWQYYGCCSTYGCGQTKFLVQRKKKPRRSQ